MSEDTDKTERFQLILECMERQAKALEQNRDALLLLDRRMDSHGLYLRGIVESMQTLAKRQSDLESMSDLRKLNCAEIMRALTDRTTALEDDRTPLPKKFTPDELESLYSIGTTRGLGNNGSGDTRLSLSEAAADDETIFPDGDKDKNS